MTMHERDYIISGILGEKALENGVELPCRSLNYQALAHWRLKTTWKNKVTLEIKDLGLRVQTIEMIECK